MTVFKAIKYTRDYVVMVASVLSLFLCFVSCTEDPHVVNQPVAKRTVLLYLPWTGNETGSDRGLYDQFLSNITDIEKAIVADGGLGDTRLFVAISQNYHSLSLFEVKCTGMACVRDTLCRYTDPKLPTREWLAGLFDDVHTISPSASCSLIIGAHGTGWLPVGSKPHQSRAFGGRSASTQASVETLAAAIVSSSMRCLEYICFDDCYMSNVETAFALRNATHYLIASTSEVMDVGLPYVHVWKYLCSGSDYRGVCDEFLRFYNSYKMPYGSLAVVDCSRVEVIAFVMRRINRLAVIDADRLAGVQRLDGFSSTVFYDLADYVTHVCDDVDLASEMRAAISGVVVAKCCTPRLYSVYDPRLDHTYEVKTFCGLTVSDPSENAVAVEAKHETEWWKVTHP